LQTQVKYLSAIVHIIFSYIRPCFLKVLKPLADTFILKINPVSGSFIFLTKRLG
jgi:hypothetical protein